MPELPAALRPSQICASFLELDFTAQAAAGRHFLILDVDNTISLQDDPALAPGVVEHVRGARASGHLRDLCLVSNIIAGPRRRRRLATFAELLEGHFVAADWRNPKPSAVPFQEALRCMGSEPRNTLVVGDQIFTDVRGGNALGIFTVLVPPLGRDHWTSRLTMRRVRERKLLIAAGLWPIS